MPFDLISSLPNMPGHHISVEVHAMGPLQVITAACASGTQALGEAVQMIRNRRAKMVFSGGSEAMIQDYTLVGFAATRTISTDNSRPPEAVSRPFDADRSGFVMSEGSAIFVLETLENALTRGAKIYAEILGHGHSSDAAHAAAPGAEGRGARLAMQTALDDAHLNAEDIHYVNAHGTSTKANDSTETFALKQVFGERAYEIPVSSTKSMIGHGLGAAGAMEALACIMTLKEGIIHPTINYETPDPECDLDYVPNVAREAKVERILSNSFGFGGQNSCIILGKFS
jgi:3-oxoacyl-(acyl-carrier-protein) synthase